MARGRYTAYSGRAVELSPPRNSRESTTATHNRPSQHPSTPAMFSKTAIMFDEDGPVTLADGTLVCARHHFETCYRCTCDYSPINEMNREENTDDDEEDFVAWEEASSDDYDLLNEGEVYLRDLIMPRTRTLRKCDPESDDDVASFTSSFTLKYKPRSDTPPVGTGRVLPTLFEPPPGYTPQRLFPAGELVMPPFIRYRNRKNVTQGLIYTDGACAGNGRAHARGGCAFVYSDAAPGRGSSCGFALEDEGPTGEKHPHTSNRAELRAVIAALRFRAWEGEGFKSMVIATDSEYVALGATEWVRGWVRRGWRTTTGSRVKNRDLWQCLLGEVELYAKIGFRIYFWRIPREQNRVADRLAKEAAAEAEAPVKFSDIHGVLV